MALAGPLETTKIQSPKDPTQSWIINRHDYDPTIHKLWETADVETSAPTGISPTELLTDADYAYYNGDKIGVYIIDPDDERRRQMIDISAYDRTIHRLWSTHPRFNR